MIPWGMTFTMLILGLEKVRKVAIPTFFVAVAATSSAMALLVQWAWHVNSERHVLDIIIHRPTSLYVQVSESVENLLCLQKLYTSEHYSCLTFESEMGYHRGADRTARALHHSLPARAQFFEHAHCAPLTFLPEGKQTPYKVELLNPNNSIVMTMISS